jgi:uncharacterized repeat protein (TIGR01451 family)
VNFSEIESLNTATDLAITKTDNTTTATPGGTVTYTITASNVGPLGIFFAHVDDTFPSTLHNISWTCTATPGSACNPGGSGGLHELLGLVFRPQPAHHAKARCIAMCRATL